MTTISFSVDCCHAHFCTDDYHLFLNVFSSCTFLYEWLPFLIEWIVVIYIYVRMITFLFKLFVVIYISVRMITIPVWMDCRHFHFCTNEYHFFVYGFSSCTFCANGFQYSLYMDFRHAHFYANDFPYSFGFSMCAMFFNAWIARCSDELYTILTLCLMLSNAELRGAVKRFMNDVIMYISFEFFNIRFYIIVL